MVPREGEGGIIGSDVTPYEVILFQLGIIVNFFAIFHTHLKTSSE
jgi:hypothetical protein